MSDPSDASLRHHRPAAHRHRAARGERRHRQDLDDRRARDEVRRRGRRAAGADAGRHLRPRRQPGAARAGARPARRGRAGARATTRPTGPPSPTAPSPSWSTMLLAVRRRAAPAGPPAGGRCAGRVRRRDDRDHPPVLLDGARLARRRRRLRLPRAAGRGPRRPGQGDRRRPLPARVRARRGGARCSPTTRRSAIARRVVDDPQARLEPEAEDRTTPAGRRVAFARAVRDGDGPPQAAARDPVLRRPAQPAARRARGAPTSPAAERMRQRWQIVLVDEFQDTDPVQWQVLDRAFTGHATMVLIGDPKQAIYAFRGGDVTTYLKAAETAATQQTLAVNWRSDEALLVAAAGAAARRRAGRRAHRGPRRRGPPRRAAGWSVRAIPFRVRVVRRQDVRGAHRVCCPLRAGAAAHRARPRPRRTPAARLGCDLRGRAVAAARHRGDQLPPRRPRRRPGGAGRGRRAGGDRGRRQRLRDPGARSSG